MTTARARRRKVAAAPRRGQAGAGAEQPGRSAGPHHHPADAMARITEALTTGGSIVVSDQGINQGETGEGTDFIVSLR